MINYKYNEDSALQEIKSYIDSTYNQHYSGKYQATDMIIDAGHGTGFCIGNIMKYAKRYGKKDGRNKKDLLKIIHYAMIQLYVQDHDAENEQIKSVKLSPAEDSIFALLKAESITNEACYRNKPINPVSKMCHACDCWKSK